MKYRLKKYSRRLKGTVKLESSKSASNRALIINALAGNQGKLSHLSDARDTKTMRSLLTSGDDILDVKDAGTTMRFLTAYLSIIGSGQTITGTDRMKKRPIGPLVDALRSLGASIEYLEEEGYPPLKIHKIAEQHTSRIQIPGNISSQYISALLMIAPYLSKGLTIELTTEIFSRPYIELTLAIMEEFGVVSQFQGNEIQIDTQSYSPTSYDIEGDWSGASYWYSMIAMAPKGSSLFLPRIKSYSSQGDRVIADILYELGVATHFENGRVKLEKEEFVKDVVHLDFKQCPDLAQTVMVVAAALGTRLEMTGLESLRIKETDRIQAMKNELAKIGTILEEGEANWTLKPGKELPGSIEVETYEDHRMAMAFAPLCQLMEVIIEEPSVVNKSYPEFWDQLKKLGVEIDEI